MNLIPQRDAQGRVIGHRPDLRGRRKGFVGVAAYIGLVTNEGHDLVDWFRAVWQNRARKADGTWDEPGTGLWDYRLQVQAAEWLADRYIGKPMISVELNAHMQHAVSNVVQIDEAAIAALPSDDLDRARTLLRAMTKRRPAIGAQQTEDAIDAASVETP